MESIDCAKEYLEDTERIKKYYADNVYKNLKEEANNIVEVLKKIIDVNADTFKLKISNSVYDSIDLYDLICRAKSPDSLKEKLIRKNLIFNIYKKDGIELEKEIKSIDDIIGIKIVTGLNHDCKNVLQLLKENNSNLISNNIILDLENEEIPDEMKNGRKIYKIKGRYKDNMHFELQIKSKIDSAWGDLEHILFYKDYDFYYIKDSNKEIMNNIGGLLEKIEDILLSVRNSKNEFSTNLEFIEFKKTIIEIFSEFILENFGTKSLLEENISKIYYLYKQLKEKNSGIRNIKNEDQLNYDIKFNEEKILDKNYLKFNKKNFEMQIIELIYWNLVKINKIDNDDLSKELIINVVKFNIIEICQKVGINEEVFVEIISDDILSLLEKDELESFHHNILLDKKQLGILVIIYSAIDEVISNLDDDYNEFDNLCEEDIEIFKPNLAKDLIMKLMGIKLKSIESFIESEGLLTSDKNIFYKKCKEAVYKLEETENKYYNKILKDTIEFLKEQEG